MFKINKVAKNLLSVGVASFISQIFTFFTIAYYARVLSVEGFGKISLAQSILVYFTMITLFGFQTLGTREISKHRDKAESLLDKIVSIRLIIASICFVVILTMAFIINKGLVFRNILIIYGLTVFPLAYNMDWLYSGFQSMEHNGIYNIIKNVIPFMLIYIFFKSEKNIYLIPIFTFVGLLSAAIYHVYILKKKKHLSINFKINKKEFIQFISASIPFLISGLLSMINCNIDSIIIGFIRSEYELGIYSSAYKIIFFLTNIIAVIFTPFFPLLISYFYEKDRENLNKTVSYICKIVMLLAIPITVGGIILSKDIIVLLFGQKYIEAYLSLIILLIYILLLFMRETYGYGLNAWNMEDKYLKSVTISSITNFILNLIFIPKFGIVAAATTTVVSEVINFVIMRKYFVKVIKTNYIYNLLRLIIPVSIMAFVIILFKWFNINIIINIISAIIIYFVAIIGLKYVTIEEIKGLLKR